MVSKGADKAITSKVFGSVFVDGAWTAIEICQKKLQHSNLRGDSWKRKIEGQGNANVMEATKANGSVPKVAEKLY
jgi:hypothetical protein